MRRPIGQQVSRILIAIASTVGVASMTASPSQAVINVDGKPITNLSFECQQTGNGWTMFGTKGDTTSPVIRFGPLGERDAESRCQGVTAKFNYVATSNVPYYFQADRMLTQTTIVDTAYVVEPDTGVLIPIVASQDITTEEPVICAVLLPDLPCESDGRFQLLTLNSDFMAIPDTLQQVNFHQRLLGQILDQIRYLNDPESFQRPMDIPRPLQAS